MGHMASTRQRMIWMSLAAALMIVVSGQQCTVPGASSFGVSPTSDFCLKGFYCPNLDRNNPNTFAAVCPPTQTCILERLKSKFCEAQGQYEPIVCPAGKVCSDFTSMDDCPSGHFCPVGTYEPIPCNGIASCSTGSAWRRSWDGVIACIIADIFLVLFIFLYRRFRKRKVTENYKQLEVFSQPLLAHDHGFQMNLLNDKSAEKKATMRPQATSDVELGSASEMLCDGFDRARDLVKQMDFEFNKLSLTLPPNIGGGKMILAGVTGRVAPGKVTAVMGPSGAGKTTFLNTLMGKVDPRWTRGGTLKINNTEAEISRFKKLVGYVPQEDIMIRELTVWENIKFSAKIRLPLGWTREQINSHVAAVVEAMQLGHVKDSVIGDENTRGISGGQRKRVNIGLELAAAPVALFLDEPTSGLDATSAMDVCNVLTHIARRTGITVAMVIHQPRVEIWDSLDDLLLLAPGGRTVYLGPQRFAERYFKDQLSITCKPQENPADVLMDEIGDKGDLCAQRWAESGESYMGKITNSSGPARIPLIGRWFERKEKTPNPTEESSKISKTDYGDPYEQLAHEKRGASFPFQFFLCHQRALKQQHKKLTGLFLEIGVSVLAGGIMGFAGQGQYQGVLVFPYTLISPSPLETIVPQMGMFINMAIGLAAASAGVKVFGEEQVVFWREAACGHNRLAYYLGKTVSQIYRFFFVALHFTAVYHLLATPMISFSHLYAIVLLCFYAVYGLAAIVSMVVNRENAPLLAVVLSLVAAVFCGYVINLPMFMKVCSYSFWATSALFNDQTFPFRDVMQVEAISAPIWGYTLDQYALDLFLIFLIGTIYRVIAFLLMIYTNRDKQK